MTTRDAVLAALRTAGGEGVSGEALAQVLGVSRVAVGKHVAALRDAGYDIAAEPGVGYRLLAVPDGPLPSEVSALLRGVEWMHLTGGGETGSTNDDARVLARAGAAEGTVVLASRQRAGRGRLGREWASPDGGVYLSIVLRPQVPPSQVAPLALVIGLGVARGLRDAFGIAVSLKWPNDVLLGGGKLAGVLLEMAAETDRVDWVVAGVGLNVRRTDGIAVSPTAATLDDTVPGVPVASAAASLLQGIAQVYGVWSESGFGALREGYEACCSLLGQEVAVRDMAGAVKSAGRMVGVDDEGRLLVASNGGVEAVSAGEVTLRRPESQGFA